MTFYFSATTDNGLLNIFQSGESCSRNLVSRIDGFKNEFVPNNDTVMNEITDYSVVCTSHVSNAPGQSNIGCPLTTSNRDGDLAAIGIIV